MNWNNFKSNLYLKNENENHPHHVKEQGFDFHSYSMETTEIEYLDFIFGMIRISKPKLVLETGTFNGIGTIAIAHALKENSLTIKNSKVVTIEENKENCKKSTILYQQESLSSLIDLKNSNSIDFLLNYNPTVPIDFVYFDSSRNTRIKEFDILKKRNLIHKGAFLVFHDTSKIRNLSKKEDESVQKNYLNGLNKIEKTCESRLNFELSRGLTVFKY